MGFSVLCLMLGGFEQKETERTKGARVFVAFVIFCGRTSFRVFRVIRGYLPKAVAWLDAAASLYSRAGYF